MSVALQFRNRREFIGVEPLDDGFREPIKSRVPILAYSGALDYKTPVSNAEEISKGFNKFVHVVNSDDFHSFCRDDSCSIILEEFLAAPPADIRSKTIEIE